MTTSMNGNEETTMKINIKPKLVGLCAAITLMGAVPAVVGSVPGLTKTNAHPTRALIKTNSHAKVALVRSNLHLEVALIKSNAHPTPELIKVNG